MVTEYFYWTFSSYLGGLNFKGRGSEIFNDWKLNTKDKLKEKDKLIFNILESPKYKLSKK